MNYGCAMKDGAVLCVGYRAKILQLISDIQQCVKLFVFNHISREVIKRICDVLHFWAECYI